MREGGWTARRTAEPGPLLHTAAVPTGPLEAPAGPRRIGDTACVPAAQAAAAASAIRAQRRKIDTEPTTETCPVTSLRRPAGLRKGRTSVITAVCRFVAAVLHRAVPASVTWPPLSRSPSKVTTTLHPSPRVAVPRGLPQRRRLFRGPRRSSRGTRRDAHVVAALRNGHEVISLIPADQ